MKRPAGKMGHAGSWCEFPDRRGGRWWCSWLAPTGEGLDHDHASAAARAWGADFSGFLRFNLFRSRSGEQPAGQGEVILARGGREQTIVPDAVEPAREDVEQKPADELLGGQRHDLLPVGIVAAVVLSGR